MNLLKRLIVVMLAFTAAAPAAPIVTFTLDPPDGFLAGAAGASVGWGYTISSTSNGDPASVFIAYFTFGDLTPVGSFSSYDSGVPFAVPSNAITDGSPITVAWLLDTSGLQYDINADAVLWAATEGAITLTYDVYSGGDQIGFGETVNAQFRAQDVNATVFVNAPASTIPEPGGVTLCALGVVALLLRTRGCGGPGAVR
jgi:hypothetical protein